MGISMSEGSAEVLLTLLPGGRRLPSSLVKASSIHAGSWLDGGGAKALVAARIVCEFGVKGVTAMPE